MTRKTLAVTENGYKNRIYVCLRTDVFLTKKTSLFIASKLIIRIVSILTNGNITGL